MFHHHEIVFSIVSGFAGTRKMEGKRGKITKLTVEIVKRRRNWKLCKNKVVNQYECPVVIHKRRSEKCAEKQKKKTYTIVRLEAVFLLSFFAFSCHPTQDTATHGTHGMDIYMWEEKDGKDFLFAMYIGKFVHFTDSYLPKHTPNPSCWMMRNTTRHSFIISGQSERKKGLRADSFKLRISKQDEEEINKERWTILSFYFVHTTCEAGRRIGGGGWRVKGGGRGAKASIHKTHKTSCTRLYWFKRIKAEAEENDTKTFASCAAGKPGPRGLQRGGINHFLTCVRYLKQSSIAIAKDTNPIILRLRAINISLSAPCVIMS